MIHRLPACIGFQAGLGRVRDEGRTIDQHVVPRLLTVGLGSVFLIPGLVRPAVQIEVDDYAAIAVPAMMHKLAGPKPWDWAGEGVVFRLVAHDRIVYVAWLPCTEGRYAIMGTLVCLAYPLVTASEMVTTLQ